MKAKPDEKRALHLQILTPLQSSYRNFRVVFLNEFIDQPLQKAQRRELGLRSFIFRFPQHISLPPPFKQNAFALFEDDFKSNIRQLHTNPRRITLPIDHLIPAEIFLVRHRCAANFEVKRKSSPSRTHYLPLATV
uniref:Uncharacterized protein n=1 Tax=Glossina austeni TaxID=7395 RepID=A0A1A9UFM9_GLOAU